MGEFELIRTLFHPLAEASRREEVPMGPGDDCAIQRVPAGQDLVFSVDTLVEGVHFPLHYRPSFLGWRALAVATSDLAAMGAEPICYTLALTLPDADASWVEGLVSGLADASSAFGMALAGGDITRGPLTLTVQVHGTVPRGSALRRDGARPGDLIAVSGPLGGAAAALAWLPSDPPPASARGFLECYHRPVPRCQLGLQLRGQVTAAIDISDGLVADLGHILRCSGVGAELDVSRVPRQFEGGEATLDQALYGGDDYQLCVTVPPEVMARLPSDVARELWVVGKITRSSGLLLADPVAGTRTLPAGAGFDHFQERAADRT